MTVHEIHDGSAFVGFTEATSGEWRQARPGETPGQVEPDDAQPQPQDLRALLAGKSDHDVVSVELLRRVLADGSGPVDLVDVEDLASLRRKAAMLPVVLLWRDHTANALSLLAAAADEQEEPSKALLDAAAHAREVLTVDPEKAYGFSGPVDLIVELDRLRALVGDETYDQDNWGVLSRETAGLDARLIRWSRRLKVVRRDLAQAERESRDLRAKLTATETGLDEAVRYATTLEETVNELRQHPAQLVEMPATVLDVSQQIRPETARLLMEDWPSIAAEDKEEDTTIGAFAREMLRLATAIETGTAPETTAEETTDGP